MVIGEVTGGCSTMLDRISFVDMIHALKPQAVLLDHAGVLVRNEDSHGQARVRVFSDAGVTITHAEGKGLMGWGEEGLFRHFQETGKYPKVIAYYKDSKTYKAVHDATYAAITAKTPVDVRQGIPEAISCIHSLGIPMAVVSNSDRREICGDLDRVVTLSNVFNVRASRPAFVRDEAIPFIISSNDIEERNSMRCKLESLQSAFHSGNFRIDKKPMPGSFMMAALMMMGECPSRVNDVRKILVIEDTQVDAALRAGMQAIHIFTPGVLKESAATPHPGAVAWVSDSEDFFEAVMPNPAKYPIHDSLSIA